MTTTDIRRFAAISALNAMVHGMCAENMQRQHRDESMAYNDSDFAQISENLMQLAQLSDDNVEIFIKTLTI